LPVQATATPKPRDTPRELRRLTTLVIVAGVIFGVAGLATFVLLATQLQRAEASTAQLIRVQEIQTDLLRADANATNAFLVGGLERADQRQAYDEAVTQASVLVAEAADAEPADRAALSTLNTLLIDYTENIELARANNRQGFPVGAQYLREASSGLRADALPILDNLVEANADRAASQMNAWISILFGIVGLVVLGFLIWTQIGLARRFKRRFNVGLVVASVVGVVTLLVALIALGWTAATVGGLREGAFTDVRDAATARIEGNNAKSNESLTLIARGSGASFEEAWQASAAVVQQRITRFRDLDTLWQPYADVHTQVRKLDDGGQWDQAVRLATTDSNTTFTSFDNALDGLVDSSARATSSGLGSATPWLVIGAVLSFAAGIVMAVFGRRGIGQRLKEYR
ncbi:MAG TPA: hypothetical protein VFU98_03040, partial [Microlunatus sp.]|nr:hypothetical protein [Microlunatus sp.]